MNRMTVNLGGLELKNPIVLASGTCGYGLELAPFFEPTLPGAVTLKGLTLQPRAGNPPRRLVETGGGVLNAIGLQNMGFDRFLEDKYPLIADSGMYAIANISGNSAEEYAELCSRLEELDAIRAVELNVSCPNVKEGGILFGQDGSVLGDLVRRCRRVLQKPLIVKLSPNVTDVVAMARICEDSGADVLTLINTLIGMAVDIKSRRPVIRNITAGYSGPAIKPVALRIVHQVSRAVGLPVIGMGGIMRWEDAAEFMIAGAAAVGIGTATMSNPNAASEILDGLTEYVHREKLSSVRELTGSMILPD